MSGSSVQAPSAGTDLDPGAKALSDLWKEALAQYRKKPESNVADIEKVIEEMSPIRDMSVVVKVCTTNFKEFREHGEKLRGVLTPIADALSFIVDAGTDAASAAMPGAALVGAAITSLLDATKKVSELYDTIEFVLGQIRDALHRFKAYLMPSVPLTHKLAESFVESLVVMLDLIAIVTKYCNGAASSLKRFIRRATDYVQQIKGNTDVKDKIDELRKLTDAQALQAAAETHANVRELQVIMTYLHNSTESHNFSAWIPLGTAQILHTRLREERAEGTCEWILDKEDFRRWRNGQIPLLAILGPAGCGKTTVCTFVIDQLQKERTQNPELPDPSLTLAYFYFREVYNKEHENDSLALMNSLALQLAQASPRCWQYLRNEYSRLRAGPLTRELLLDMLRDMLKLLGPTFIVIDALDECYSKDPRSSATQTRMLEFLRDLCNSAPPNLRLLVMSRPEPSILQILTKLDPAELWLSETEEHRAGIARYIEEHLPKNDIWKGAMRERATEALNDSKESQGMFLWVSLQIQHLDRLTTPDEINEALDKLPEGLEQTYRGILQRFGAATTDVRSVLGFVAFSLEPLTVADVYAALSFNFGTAKIKRFTEDPENFIIRVLPGLIKIVDLDEKRIVQFIHFSVKEYLTSDALCRDENMCGYYLDQHSSDLAIATLLLAALEPKNVPALGGLYNYAAEHWHKHIPLDIRGGNWRPDISNHPSVVERGVTAECVDRALTAFLDAASPAFKSWKALHYWAAASAMPLHYVAYLDLPDLVARLIKQGADCNAFADGRTPLHYTAWSGADSCTEALLKHGADPNLTQIRGYTALHEAAYHGNTTIVRALLDAGADIQARATMRYNTGIGDTPLYSAILAGEASICELLLRRKGSSGLEDIRNWKGQTPLHYAAEWDEAGIVGLLLDVGASAHAVDLRGNTPVSIARDKRNDRCVRLLEEHLKNTSRSDESPRGYTAGQDSVPSEPTPDLTLHAFLQLKDSTPLAGKPKQPFTVQYSVNMGWSCNLESVHNNCMLTLTLTPHDDESDSVHCVAELYGINTDGSTWKLPDDSLEDQSFSLSRKTQENCCKETAATISRAESSQQHAAESAVPRLLVHSVPTSDLPYHSPMCFPVPPEVFEMWKIPDQNDNAFILQKLATAAVHFRSCHRHDIESLDADKSKSDGELDVEEQTTPSSDATKAEIEQGTPSLPPTSTDVPAVKPTSPSDADVDIAEGDQNSRPPSPSPVDVVEVEQTTPSTSASKVGEHTPDEPIEGAAAPFVSPTSVLLLCGIFATAAVLYAGAVRRNPRRILAATRRSVG